MSNKKRKKSKKGKTLIKIDFSALEQKENPNSDLEKEIVKKIVYDYKNKLRYPDEPEIEGPQLSPYQQALLDIVKEAMKELTPKQVQVLKWTAGLDGEEVLTERQIGERLKISHQGVSHLKERAISAIKNKIEVNDALLKSLKHPPKDE